MRAVVLANQSTINLLNQEFVNVWVLKYELEVMRDKVGLAKMPSLAREIVKVWKPISPVDSLVISPDLDLIGLQRLHDLVYEKRDDVTAKSNVKPELTRQSLVDSYRDFLKASLKGDRPGVNGLADVSARSPANK